MDQDQAYICRFCFKIFPSSSSLGGHVRSHMFSSSSSSNEDKDQKPESGVGFHGASTSCYGLRKNPRKTKRFIISTTSTTAGNKDEQQRIICSKSLGSREAQYCGMKDHSDKGKMVIQDNQNEEEEEEEISHENSLSSRSCTIRLTVPIKRKRSKRSFMSSSSSLCLESKHSSKLQDAVDSLMMLSQDAVCFSITKDVDHVSKNDKYDFDSDSDYFNVESSSPDSLMEIKKINFDASYCKVRINSSNDSIMRKYECIICKKSFATYQAFGGHNASHKRMRSCAIEVSQEVTGNSLNKHECSICRRVFSSGNALGGHKRSHFIMAVPIALNQEKNDEENAKVIDLNVPARIEDDDAEPFLDESMVTE